MPEPDRSERPGERLLAVEHIRGIAALAVAWFHLTNTYGGAVALSGSLGWLGVDCFFVISGFVIPLSLHRIGYTLARFPAFMTRRLIRLEPPYLISLVLVVVLQFSSSLAQGFNGQPTSFAPAQIALHAFYLIPFSDYPWLSPVYWSLAYEFVFYALAGLLFPLLWRRPAIVTIVLVCGLSLPTEFSAPSPRIPLFLMGIAAARHHCGRDSASTFALGLACAVATMMAGGLVGAAPQVEPALSAVAGVLTAVIAATGSAHGRRSPWLGTISYALYLTHVPVGGRVVNLGRRFVDGPLQELILSLVALGVCLAFAALFHRLVEAPFLRLSRHVSLGGSSVPATRLPTS